eukprot:symbB.v1.2.033882.t1/scaffold4274.1/size42556/4
MSGRGGSNRRKILPVNQDQLQEVFDAAVSAFAANAFYLGAYEGVKTTQAASCQGLYDCKWWLERLLPICNGEIVPQQLKVCLKKHAGSHNESQYKDDLWAGKMACKFVVLLHHWRRLKYNPEKRRQAMLKATPQMQASAQKLLDLEPGLSEACDKAKTSSGEACEKAKEADEISLSEVSLDSKGFPNMLRTPDTKKGAAASSCRGLKESQAPQVLKGKTPSPKSSRKKDKLPILLSKKARSHKDTLESQAAAAAVRKSAKLRLGKGKDQQTFWKKHHNARCLKKERGWQWFLTRAVGKKSRQRSTASSPISEASGTWWWLAVRSRPAHTQLGIMQ